MDNGNTDFITLNGHERLAQSFYGPLYIAFDNEGQFFQFALLDLIEQIIQSNLGIDM